MKFSHVSGVVLLFGFYAAVGIVSGQKNLSESGSGRKFFSLPPIFPLFSDKINNEVCSEDSKIFREQLAQFRLWAVKMFDASSKFPDGILAGNNFQLGHFDECLSVSVPLPKQNRALNGQYCLAEIEFSPKNSDVSYPVYDRSEDNLFDTSAWNYIKSFNNDRSKTRRDVIYWALCIPESCRPGDLKNAIDEVLESSKNFSDINISVKVEDKFCQLNRDAFDFSWVGPTHLAFIGVVAVFVILALLAMAFDLNGKKKKGRLATFLGCFSPQKNFADLMTVDETKDITPIHTLRFLSMVMVIIMHRVVGNARVATFNHDFMEIDIFQNPWILGNVMGPVVLVVDTFFLIGGFLTANQMIQSLNKKKFSLFSNYVHRYIRLTPVLMLIVAFYATFLYRIASGPLWKARIGLEADRCAANWWTNLLYVNTYVNAEDSCVGQTWYLACDFHFYILSPPIIYLLWKNAALGFTVISSLIIVGVVGVFALTFNYQLDPAIMPYNSVLVDFNSDPTFLLTYVPSHARFLPYLVGIIVAYYYNKRKSFKLSSIQQSISIILILTLAHIPVFVPVFLYWSGYQYDKVEAAFYAAFHRIPWSVGVGWLAYLGATGNAGILQRFLSWKVLTPLSRLSYCVFLCHTITLFGIIGTNRTPEYNSFPRFFWTMIGDLQVDYFVAFFVHILFEAPISKLDRTYLTSGRYPKNKKGINVEVDQPSSDESLPSELSVTDRPLEKYLVNGNKGIGRKNKSIGIK